MKKSTLIVGMMLLYFGLSAQQDPQFTQWMFDKVSFNPAATGANDAHCVSLFYRDQWDGLENDPKTAMFNYNGLFGGNIGVGIVAVSDKLGQMQNTTIKLNGAYHIQLDIGTISGGLSASMYGLSLGDDWRPTTGGDPTVPTTATATSVTDFGFGVMLRNQDFYVGLSSTHLNESEMQLETFGDFNVIRHYYLMGGYDYELDGTDIKLRSNVLVKSDAHATIFDVNVNALWNDMLWAGVSYRLNDAIAPMAGIQYNLNQIDNGKFIWDHKIMLGYSYDATLSELNTVSSGSHEIFLTYCFNIQEIIIKRIYSNPRFL